jgi:hypothetical protein
MKKLEQLKKLAIQNKEIENKTPEEIECDCIIHQGVQIVSDLLTEEVTSVEIAPANSTNASHPRERQ